MKKILTIGIPVYNMEKYLHRCLTSVTGIKHRDLCEIIVVNDGSKDRSLEIAREFEACNPDLLRVIDKPNGGWGSGINRSIEEAQGEYYKSLDSDDWFCTESLDRFIEELQTIDADMVLSPYNEVDENDNKIERDFSPELYGQTYDLNDYVRMLGTFRKTIHAVTYRTKMLKEHRFHVWEKFYGDIDYINTPLSYVKTIYFSPYRIYQYLVGREGQSISVKGYRAHIADYLSVARKLISSTGDKQPQSPIEKYLFEDNLNIAAFAYRLLMQPSLCGNEKDSGIRLKEFDGFLKTAVPLLYKKVTSKTRKFGVSPISVWRLCGLNIYKILSAHLA